MQYCHTTLLVNHFRNFSLRIYLSRHLLYFNQIFPFILEINNRDIMCDRRLFSSPPQSPHTPKKFKSPSRPKPSFQGYVVHVGQVVTSHTKGNSYFDVQFQHKKDAFVEFRVMIYTDELQNFQSYKARKEGSVLVENISTHTETWFFNARYGSKSQWTNFKPNFPSSTFTTPVEDIVYSPNLINVKGAIAIPEEIKTTGSGIELKEAVLLDESGQIKITLWEGKFQHFRHKHSYHVTNVSTKMFDGVVIATTMTTNIEEIPTIDVSWDEFDENAVATNALPSNTTICCPEVTGVEMWEERFCSKISCREPVPKEIDVDLHTCTSCGKMLKLPKLGKVFNGLIDIEESENNTKTLSFDANAICSFYKVDNIKFTDFTSMKTRLMMEDKLHICLKTNSTQILNFSRHQEKSTQAMSTETTQQVTQQETTQQEITQQETTQQEVTQQETTQQGIMQQETTLQKLQKHQLKRKQTKDSDSE